MPFEYLCNVKHVFLNDPYPASSSGDGRGTAVQDPNPRSRRGLTRVPGMRQRLDSLVDPVAAAGYPRSVAILTRRFQKLLGSQMTSAVAMLKKMRATARITILRRRSSHFSPTPQRKRTIAKIRVVRI